MKTTKAAHTSYRHIWRLSWPVMVSNTSLPLVGAVDVAMMGHLPDPAFVGGVALGGLIFNFVYLTFAFLRMGTTGLTALAAGAGKGDEVACIFIRGHLIAFTCGFTVIACLPAISWLAAFVLTASADSLAHMQSYLEIRIWSLPATLANAVMLGSLFGLAEDAALHGSATDCESAEHSSEPVICASAGLASSWGGSGLSMCGMGGVGPDGCDCSTSLSEDDSQNKIHLT